jgi:hypothetical protein
VGEWILDADEVRTARSQVANPRIYGHVSDERVLALCNTVDALRARAEKAEAALVKAERLTSRCITFGAPGLRWFRCEVCQHEHRDREGEPHHTATCPFAVLGGTDERSVTGCLSEPTKIQS